MNIKMRTSILAFTCLVLVLSLSFVAFAKKEEPIDPYNRYFGDLHAHTAYSDGWEGTPADVYASALSGGADFMATTDHAYMLSEEEWSATLQAADEYTEEGKFVALAAYEFWMPGFGEVNVFNVNEKLQDHPSLHKPRLKLPRWEVPGAFYDHLANLPGAVGLWVHPTDYSKNFDNFGHWTELRDGGMGLLEIHNYGSWLMPYQLLDYEESYVMALDNGWHVMPAANSDTHSPDWINGYEVRTVLLAHSLNAENLFEAMRSRRGYATLDKNLEIFYTLNGEVMGSELSESGSSYTARIFIHDPDELESDVITRVEIISDGGSIVAILFGDSTIFEREITIESEDAHYFYLRVYTASNLTGEEGITAWTAPVWTGR